MSNAANLLTYERRPVGRVLVDEDPDGSVTVRVFFDARTPWGSLLFFGGAGVGGVLAAARAAGDGEAWAALAFAVVGTAALLATAWVIFGAPAEPITFRATREGLEYRHLVFGEAVIPREEIADLVVAPSDRAGMSLLRLRAPSGAEGILGGGTTEEVVAIAVALRKGLGIIAAASTADGGGTAAFGG